MGQSSGVLFKEVSAFRRCPIIPVSLYIHNACIYYFFIYIILYILYNKGPWASCKLYRAAYIQLCVITIIQKCNIILLCI